MSSSASSPLGWSGRSPSAQMRSSTRLKKLAELGVRTIVCYLGGVVQEDVHEQLRRVAKALVK